MGNPVQNRQAYKRWRQRLRDKIDAVKSTPCADCGVSYVPYVMDFDHRPGEVKSFNISSIIPLGISFETALVEIAKCDIVCANCHRLRTLSRMERPRLAGPSRPHQKDRTHCPRGHAYSPDNTRVKTSKDGKTRRLCLTCTREQDARRGREKRARQKRSVPVPDTDDLLFQE